VGQDVCVWKYVDMTNSKTQKLPLKQKLKNSKSDIRRPQIKKFTKQTIVTIEKY